MLNKKLSIHPSRVPSQLYFLLVCQSTELTGFDLCLHFSPLLRLLDCLVVKSSIIFSENKHYNMMKLFVSECRLYKQLTRKIRKKTIFFLRNNGLGPTKGFKNMTDSLIQLMGRILLVGKHVDLTGWIDQNFCLKLFKICLYL